MFGFGIGIDSDEDDIVPHTESDFEELEYWEEMALSAPDYFSRAVECLESQENQDPVVQAVIKNDVDVLATLPNSTKWYTFVQSDTGNSLLHIAVLCGRKEVFHHLLAIDNYPLDHTNNENETVLNLCFKRSFSIYDQFACELIKRGASVDCLPLKDGTLLHYSVEKEYVQVSKLLMRMGYNVNALNSSKYTPLELCLEPGDLIDSDSESNTIVLNDNSDKTEIATALLCYGADPNFGHRNALEATVTSNCSNILKEAIFLFMIDDISLIDISFDSMLHLAEQKSPLFFDIASHAKISGPKLSSMFDQRIFFIDFRYLEVLVQKCPNAIRKVLSNIALLPGVRVQYEFHHKKVLETLSFFIESDLKDDTLAFIASFQGNFILISRSIDDENLMLEFVCFFLSYGCKSDEYDLSILYNKFGFGKLLKVLLYTEVERTLNPITRGHPFVLLLLDVHYDLQQILRRHEDYDFAYLSELLYYFSNAELRELFSNDKRPKVIATIANQPAVPLLVQLSRDVFRKHFIRTFSINSAAQFYTFLDQLPIPSLHKEIISYNKKLYFPFK